MTHINSKALFPVLFDEHPAPMWIYDASSQKILHVNEAALELYGYSREEFLEMSLPMLGEPGRHRKKDGSFIDVELSTRAIHHEGKELVVTMVFDVTDRKRAENRLRDSEARLRFIFHWGRTALWDWDIKSDTIHRLPGHSRLWGYEEDLPRWNFEVMLSKIHPEDRARVAAAIEKAREGLGYDIEYRVVWPDESVHWLRAVGTSHRDETGAVTRMTGMTHEITARKTAEEALRESRERLQFILDSAEIVTWDADLSLRQVAASDGREKLTGYREDKGQWDFKSLLKRLAPGNRKQVREKLLDCYGKGGGTFEMDLCLLWGDGSPHWIHIKGSMLPGLSGKPERATGIAFDITQKKRIVQALEESRLKAITASRLSELGEMASGIAHEINNPLAIIHGSAERLRKLSERTLIPPDEVARYAERISATAMRISKIVKGLGSFAREASQDAFEVVTVRSIIDDTLGFCRERFRHHHVNLTLDPIPDELKVECRVVQISQVLLNLLNNAYDAVEGKPEKWVKVGAEDWGACVAIRVTDSGPGIPPEIEDKMFQPFFTTKEVGKGTGLGLSVSKGIVESHEGLLKVDSSSPHTSFLVILPKSQKLQLKYSASPTAA